MAQHVTDMLFQVDGVQKIDVLGIQQESIFIETSNAKLAYLGISPDQLVLALRSQNVIRPGGTIDANGRNFTIQPSGNFDTVEDIRNTLIKIPGRDRSIALLDIARVERSVVDPPVRTAYFNGEQVIVFAISQTDKSDVLKFTPRIEKAIADLNQSIPAGYKLENITRQADVVEKAVYGVSLSVLQTIVVVTLVVVMILGLRTGLIVASIVPATILITLAVMNFFDMPLERMSLATLIIALGLLVDDGIIISEDYKRRIEDGEERSEALKNTPKSLAIPSLISSLTTILVFLPLMLAGSDSSEYTRSISLVVLISLLLSWLLSLTFTIYLCHRFVKKQNKEDQNFIQKKISEFFDKLNPAYDSLLRKIMQKRLSFVILMVGFFIAGGWIMSLIPAKFFPDSDRAQVLVYLDMPAGTSMRETDATLQEIFTYLDNKERFPHIEKYAAYGGFGGPRFVLSLTPIDPENSKGFFMIDVGKRENADPTIKTLRAMLANEFPGVMGRVTKMFLGPADSSLIEVQIKGPDANYIYKVASQIENILADIEGAYDIKHDWENMVTELQVEVNQQNARRAGVSSLDIAQSLQTYFSGRVVTEFREGDDLFPIILRAEDAERYDLDRLQSVNVYSQTLKQNIPLMQVASINYGTSFARIARENLFRTVTVESKNRTMSAEGMVPLLQPELDKIRENLLLAYQIEYDGVVKDSKESQESLNASLPLCFALMVLLVLAQFGSYRATAIVFLTLPLIIIGASVGLFVMGADFGFMVILGLYALAGIIINNAVILIDRINIERNELLDEEGEGEQSDEQRNRKNYEAIISASVRRLRPIIMSTTTTVLGLMPLILSKDVLFYGQASAIAFGLIGGTVLTLGFVPVLYSYFFKVEPVKQEAEETSTAPGVIYAT